MIRSLTITARDDAGKFQTEIEIGRKTPERALSEYMRDLPADESVIRADYLEDGAFIREV